MSFDLSKVVFLDTETTGLHEGAEVWDLALDMDDKAGQWFFKPEVWWSVDASALKIGHYYERTKDFRNSDWSDPSLVLPGLAARLQGRHIVGSVPNFDETRLKPFFRDFNAVLTTHYHLVDIENLIVGYAAAKGYFIDLPWKSDDLSRLIGVEPPNDETRHTAAGDVAWVKEQFIAIGNGVDLVLPS